MEGGGVDGGVCRLMCHLLFEPRYLDYVQTDLGGLLRPVTELSARAFFSFHCLSTSPTLPLAKHTAVLFFPLSSSPLLAYPVTSHHRAQIPPSPLSLHPSIHPSIHPSTHPSMLLPPSYPTLFPQPCFPLFCGDIKQLTACLVAGLQCAGRVVLYIQVLCESQPSAATSTMRVFCDFRI